MKHWRLLLGTVWAAVVVALLVGDGSDAAGPIPRVDAQGDPLPRHVITRFGSSRWKPGRDVLFAEFLPDGKTLLALDSRMRAYVLDARTGVVQREFLVSPPVQPGDEPPDPTFSMMSADGKWLVVGGPKGLLLCDVPTGRLIHTLTVPQVEFVEMMAFLSDGKHLAACDLTAGVFVWDMNTGKAVQTCKLPAKAGDELPLSLSSNQDGTTLYLATGLDAGLRVRTFDLETGKMLKQTKAIAKKGGFQPEWGFTTPDGGTLVAWGAHEKADVRVIDLAEGKEVKQFKAGKALHGIGLDPDGKRLVTLIGRSQLAEWDVATGKEVRRAPAKPPAPTPWEALAEDGDPLLAIGPGGHYIADIIQNRVIRVIDRATGETVTAQLGHAAPVDALAFAADGKGALTMSINGDLRVWDGGGRETAARAAPMDGTLRVLSPRGQLAVAEPGKLTVRDPVRDRQVFSAKGPDQPLGVAFSGDGRRVAVYGQKARRRGTESEFTVLDTATGKTLSTVKGTVQVPGQPAVPEVTGMPLVALSGDGRTLAGTNSGGLSCWPLRTGRERRILGLTPEGGVSTLALSHDGRTLAVGLADGAVVLFETLTGQKRAEVAPARPQPLELEEVFLDRHAALAFSPDGRLLAFADEEAVVLYDVLAGKPLTKLTGHTSPVSALVFRADGGVLLSGAEDGTALSWDLSDARGQLARPGGLTAADRLRHWEALAGEDGERAARAAGALALDTGAVRFLAERVKHPTPPDPEAVKKWIADLDHDEYAIRKAARDKLEAAGLAVRAALEETLKGTSSPEVRKQVEELLGMLEGQNPTRETVRALRAVETLEIIGNAEARTLLKGLSKGAAESALTQHAREALERLGPDE